MAYVKTNWVHGVTVGSAANMNHLETQCEESPSLYLGDGHAKRAGDLYYDIPGASPFSVGTEPIVADMLYYFPIWTNVTIQIYRLMIEVAIPGAAGKVARLGIYNCDEYYNPLSLVVDAGTVLIDAAAVKTIVLGPPLTLTYGRYLLALLANKACTLRAIRCTNRYTSLMTAMGGNPIASLYRVIQAYGALPDPGLLWDTATASAIGYPYFVFTRIGV